MRELNIATAPNRDSFHWSQDTPVAWQELVDWTLSPADHKECGNYLLGQLRPTELTHKGDTELCSELHRNKLAVASRSAITMDVDHPEPGFVRSLKHFCLVHSTYSSSPDAPRYRVIMPTDRDMTPEEYHIVVDQLMTSLGADQFDPGSVQPERYMFRPAAQQPGWFQTWEIQGPTLSVDDVLAGYDPDLSKLPLPKAGARKRNPFELEGAVGAFNRAYTIEAVIDAYDLPYLPVGDRWQLVGAKSEAGMGLVDDGLVFSHHVTDPAGGQTCSAFDLVRLHRFSHLDEASPDGTPVNRLPSHAAMLDVAATDPRVIADMVGADFNEEMDALEQSDWRLRLQMNPRNGKFLDVIQNWDLIRDNDPVFQLLYFNEMTTSVEVDGDLPWRPLTRGGQVFTSIDRAALTHYLEREFGFRAPRALIDDLVETRAQQRYINPIRDYLEGLEWDGVERLDECLPGVRPTPYSRMVARKSLVAAVARILQPGVKWDHTLILYGLEGLGKSYWIEKMARGYSATLGRIGDKDTLLAMQRSWIMVSDEGHSLRKAEFDVQKEFLTRTEDVFRMPYDREVQLHKRHCVIWGTTNDEVFLRRQEGNRRFLIVRCEDKVDFEALTDQYVDAVWAEALHAYRSGERLFLAETESAAAAAEREGFTEEDALAGVLHTFLETLVPDEWDFMSPDSRREWFQNRADGLVPEGTNPIMETCSAQLWVEALGRRFGEHRRVDLLEIVSTMKQIPGWKSVAGRHRVPHYGPQIVFRRIPDSELL